MEIPLSTLSVILGLIVALPHVYGVAKPGAFAAAARKFPRHTALGWVLTLAATVWFLYNVSQENVTDFASMKSKFYLVFAAVGIGTCVFVKDFLPVRGLAALLLLAAKLMVDSARWEQTEWRLLITAWAYVWVLAGMWFTISPWRLRDLINWAVATEGRTRMVCAWRAAFGVLVILLGLTVFKTAEQKAAASTPPPAPSSGVIQTL